MRTLALIALTVGALACAKDQSASKADETAPKAVDTAAAKVATAPAGEAETTHCDKPGEGMAGECGAEEMAGGCNKWDDEAAAVNKRDVPDNAVWKTLKVKGMTCGGCERRVIAHVGKLDGVVSVEADSELGEVRVAMSVPSDRTDETAKAAEAEITRLGYRVE